MLFEWTSILKVNFFLLKFVGLWPEGNRYKFNLYLLWAFIALILLQCGHVLTMACTLYFELEDIDNLTDTACLFNSELLVVWKMINFAQNREVFKQLLLTVEQPMFQPKNTKQIESILPNIQEWKYMRALFGACCLSCIFFFSFLPIFAKSYNKRTLPFMIWYPFDSTKSPFYEICYAYQIASITSIAIVAFNVDTLIGALNMYIGTQCDLLCDNLRTLKSNKTGKTINQKFIDCIIHHKNIVR